MPDIHPVATFQTRPCIVYGQVSRIGLLAATAAALSAGVQQLLPAMPCLAEERLLGDLD